MTFARHLVWSHCPLTMRNLLHMVSVGRHHINPPDDALQQQRHVAIWRVFFCVYM